MENEKSTYLSLLLKFLFLLIVAANRAVGVKGLMLASLAFSMVLVESHSIRFLRWRRWAAPGPG